jgi:5-methylcytosine-specific restriction endonuclease McrA
MKEPNADELLRKIHRLCEQLGLDFNRYLEEKLKELEYRKRFALITNETFRGKIESFVKKVLASYTQNDFYLALELNRNRWSRPPLLERYRYHIYEQAKVCQVCGRRLEKGSMNIDHKVPVYFGGATEIENLWLLCEECNKGKSNLPYDYLGASWLLEGKSSWHRLRYCVIMRDGRRCRICGRTYKEVQLDAYLRIPPEEGGRWIFDHMITLCQDCAKKTKH